MKKSDFDRYRFEFSTLKNDNLEQFYNFMFAEWLVYNSHLVKIEGKEYGLSDNTEKTLKLMPYFISGEVPKIEYVSETTENGIPLTEKKFIIDQKRKYEPVIEKLEQSKQGIEKNRKLYETIQLYIGHVERRLNELNAEDVKEQNISKNPEAALKNKLSLSQIALKHYYLNDPITRGDIANDIAKSQGWKSGEALYQDYSYYSSRINRQGNPSGENPLKLINKIKLFESVKALLPEQEREEIEKDLSVLNKTYKTNYQ